MVSLLLNLKPFLPVFIPFSRNLKLNIHYEMSVPERSLGSFRPVFHTHFKPMPPLKNFKDPFCSLWCHVALPLASAQRGKSKGTVLFFSLYFPLVFKHKIMLLGWLLKVPKKPTHSGPLWVPEILFCSTQGWDYCNTKGLCSRPPPGSSARILSQIYSLLTLKTFSPDSPLQTKVRFPACSSFV